MKRDGRPLGPGVLPRHDRPIENGGRGQSVASSTKWDSTLTEGRARRSVDRACAWEEISQLEKSGGLSLGKGRAMAIELVFAPLEIAAVMPPDGAS